MASSSTTPADPSWLRKLYLARAVFSLTWVVLAFTLAPRSMALLGALIVLYPAWDALANVVDARQSGGLAANLPQAANAVVSAATTLAMAVAVGQGMPAIFQVFGVWALLAGLLQLGTALRRWKHLGAQWPMVLSGAQSAAAGIVIFRQASSPSPTFDHLAGYATVGAVYFLVSAAVLFYQHRRSLRSPARA